jgi:TonB family protein
MELMKNFSKNLILAYLVVGSSDSALGAQLEDLKLAPKIPIAPMAGQLKQLANEPGYHPPKRIFTSRPVYPWRQLNRYQEGMVDIRFMVDKDGKVFEPIVIASTHSAFEAPALKAVSKYEYEPAYVDETKFNATAIVRISFRIEDSQDATSREFALLYKRTDEGLNAAKPDQQTIRRNLDRLAHGNYLTSYGLAYLSMLEYRYASKFSSKKAQLKALRKLLLFEDQVDKANQFLDEAVIKSIRMNILQLLIELGYYGEARSNFYWLNREIPSAAALFEETMVQVRKILNEGEPIMRPLELGKRGYEYVDLAKKTFEIDVTEGAVEKLKFYCTRSFGTMDHKPNSNYQVPEGWGACNLLVVGEPNTKAKLYQL